MEEQTKNVQEMTIEELRVRAGEIRSEVDKPGANLDALDRESKEIRERIDQYETEQRRKGIVQRVADGGGEVIRKFESDAPEERKYSADSEEYRTAFFKNLLGQEMTKEERAAFVHTTSNTGATLPTTTLNTIWDLVSKQHAIMQDITIYRTGTVIEVIKHTAIVQGAAKTVAENAANDDEQNTFVKVTLSGKDFSKHVDVSYAMERMSVEALEQYLINEISASLGDAMASDVAAQIGTDMTSGNKVESAASGTVTFKELATIFGKLKRVSDVKVYATRATIYTYLVGLTDTNGRPIFQPSAQAGQEGVVLGAQIKPEDAVADDTILIGDPKRFVYNMIQDIMIESDKDIKKHVTTYSGYARGSGTLIDPDAFAQLTVKAGG